MPKYNAFDDEDLETLYEDNDRRAHRRRKVRKQPPKKDDREIIEQLTDRVGVEAGLETTYQPAKHERGWLRESIQSFYYQDLIVDVEAKVKGGKEASVYRCAAHQTLETRWVAAKVYRPRMFRELRNDQTYREGRQTLTVDGKALNERDYRAQRAMNKGSNFGQKLEHTSWIMHEYQAMQTLYEAGAAVPKPYATSENAILMGYFGDENLAAPTLSEVEVSATEALHLFETILHNIHLLLQHGWIHGDLSAYNILYDHGSLVLIDFPQVVEVATNSSAQQILARDVARICDYFATYDLRVDADAITADLWDSFGHEAEDQDVLLFNMRELARYAEYSAEPDDD